MVHQYFRTILESCTCGVFSIACVSVFDVFYVGSFAQRRNIRIEHIHNVEGIWWSDIELKVPKSILTAQATDIVDYTVNEYHRDST